MNILLPKMEIVENTKEPVVSKYDRLAGGNPALIGSERLAGSNGAWPG